MIISGLYFPFFSIDKILERIFIQLDCTRSLWSSGRSFVNTLASWVQLLDGAVFLKLCLALKHGPSSNASPIEWVPLDECLRCVFVCVANNKLNVHGELAALEI